MLSAGLHRTALGGAVLLAGLVMAGQAGAVPFDVTAVTFSPGTGYGDDASETSSPTLLEVTFDNSAFSEQIFSLNSVGAFSTFDVGTIDFEEPDAGGGIVAAETDNLGVTATFSLTDPLGVNQDVTATGSATTGSVSDAGVDYTLDWTPVTVNFGVGGQFRIDLLDLSFDDQGQQTQTATITLLALPEDGGGETALSEPAALAALGIGLIFVGWVRRRRMS